MNSLDTKEKAPSNRGFCVTGVLVDYFFLLTLVAVSAAFITVSVAVFRLV